jgi:hypothetical protein
MLGFRQLLDLLHHALRLKGMSDPEITALLARLSL